MKIKIEYYYFTSIFLSILLMLTVSSKIYSDTYYYDRSAAIAYADSYWEKYNFDLYSDFSDGDGDCANFVTQCLVAGGRSPYDPHYNEVYNLLNKLPTFYSCTKQLVPYLRRIAKETQGDPSNLIPGDIILFKHNPGDTDFYHAAIVVEVDGSNIYFNGHTTDRKHQLLYNTNNERLHYFHILDGYIFWSDWSSWGSGYYYHIFGSVWAGPHLLQNFSAAGVNPQNGSEYRGFNQFTVYGIPPDNNIVYAHLRFIISSKYGSSSLALNINHITNTGEPTPYECAAPPYYLQNEEVDAQVNDTLWFDLSNTNAPMHIMEANNGNNMFGIGLSDNYAKLLTLYFFYGCWWGSDVNAKLKVFVDNSRRENIQNSFNTPDIEEINIEPLLNVKNNLVSHDAEIFFSSGEENEAIIKIYDIGGRHIRTWIAVNSHVVNRIQWDLRDNLGNRCPHGIYFVRLTTPTITMTEKLEILQ